MCIHGGGRYISKIQAVKLTHEEQTELEDRAGVLQQYLFVTL